jgi:hypothetical protein
MKKVKKPCCRGFGWVSRAPLGRLVGPRWSRWGLVGLGGPGGMFIDTRKNVLYPPIQNGRVKCIMLPRRNHTLPPNPDHLGVKYILICSGYPDIRLSFTSVIIVLCYMSYLEIM